jgi:multidrug resistance efflux pump
MRYLRPALAWLIAAGLLYLGYLFVWPLFLPEEQAMDVQTAVVQRSDLRRVVPADGVLRPAVLVEVKSRASGVVEEISVEPGDDVQVGDVLVELDKERIVARKRQAEASLLSAQARLSQIRRDMTPQQKANHEHSIRQAEINLTEARNQLVRIEELYSKSYATDEELEQAQRAVETAEESLSNAQTQYELDLAGGEEEDIAVAEAQVEIARAELDDVNEELSNTTIRAPIDGRVLTRPVEIGTAVASGTTGNTGGTVVATVGDLSTLFVEANLDETDLGRVQLEMPCRVTFDAFVGYVWSGQLVKVYPQGQSGQGGSTTFLVDIEVDLEPTREDGDGPGGTGMMASAVAGGWAGSGGGGRGRGGPGGGSPPAGEPGSRDAAAAEEGGEEVAGPPAPVLRPNMTANVEFVLEDHPDVLILQARFVQYDEERRPFVDVLPDPEDQGRRERRDIELGFTDGLRYEVVSGLTEGEMVIFERPVIED